MKEIVAILTGFSGGLIVGGGIAAFFTVLGVVARIMAVTRTVRYIQFYKLIILLGAVLSSCAYIFDFSALRLEFMLLLVGLSMGVFIGMIASALAEVINVIPIITSLIGEQKWIYIIIISMILGKIIGSIVYWMVPGFY